MEDAIKVMQELGCTYFTLHCFEGTWEATAQHPEFSVSAEADTAGEALAGLVTAPRRMRARAL